MANEHGGNPEATYTKGKGVTWCGKRYTIVGLARDFGIDRKVLARRLQAGMSVEQALSRPTRKRKPIDARKAAEKVGATKFEGKVCDRHDHGLRYVSNYRCVECHDEDQKARRAARRASVDV